MRNYIKIGVAGPVGAGKTALIEKLTREIASKYSVAVITNDIYTQEDAEFLTKTVCFHQSALWAWKRAVAHIRQFVKMLR